MRKITRLIGLSAIALLLSHPATAVDAKYYGNRIVVKFKATTNGKSQILNADKMHALQTYTGKRFEHKRNMADGSHVLTVANSNPATMDQLVDQLRQRSDVEFAEIDYKRYPIAFSGGLTPPDDPDFNQQWHLLDNSTAANAGAVNAVGVWQNNITGNGVTIAVIDTGITLHRDLGSNVINGYDFINLDGNGQATTDSDDEAGRDNDASDPGDQVTQTEKNTKPTLRDDDGCFVSASSSWHGTLVSGVIAANTNNTLDIAGLAPNATVVVSRALGKCGGYNSDLMDAARWAAGLSIADSGVPANPNPAKIINLSLGGGGGCSQVEQSAISAIVAAGNVVVVAAGNESADSATSAPGNCKNTINVGATTRMGGQASYSNFGEGIDISAPGGSGVAANRILSTSQNKDVGLVTDTSTSNLEAVQGTSFSAPIVSGIIAMMLEKNAALTPQQIYGTLLANVTTFPTSVADSSTICTTTRCGAGIVNALAVYNALDNNNITSTPFPDKTSVASPSTSSELTPPTLPASGGGGGYFGAGSCLFALWLLRVFRRARH